MLSASPAVCVVGVHMWRRLVWVRVWSVARASGLEIRKLQSKRYTSRYATQSSQRKEISANGNLPPLGGWFRWLHHYKLLALCFARCNCTGPGIASCNEGIWFWCAPTECRMRSWTGLWGPQGNGTCNCKDGYTGEKCDASVVSCIRCACAPEFLPRCDECKQYFYNLENGFSDKWYVCI